MSKPVQVYSRIKLLRERYYRAVSGKDALMVLINEAEVSEQVYNSNAIENSTLSLEETEKILLQIDLDRFISERELFETKNLARVVTYIGKKAKQQEVDLDLMLSLHQMLLSNIRDDVAGRFRSANEWVRVGNHIAADPKQVVKKLQEMLIDYQISPNEHIITKIAKFHLTFEHIHPFVDGNGRIGRVLNNYLLIREGYVPINIKFIDRSLYYDAFQEYDKSGKLTIMESIVGKAMTSSYHKRLAYLEGKEIVSLKEYAKKHNQSLTNLYNKANRQTIDAFMEKGKWKIGL